MNSLLTLLSTDPKNTLVALLALIIGISVHEFAHAWTATKLGDETPRLQGRVTLNPAAHLDPLGSIFFLLTGIGWGRPVIYNPMRLKRRSDELVIALAGPASNLLLALLFNILATLLFQFGKHFTSTPILIASDINVLLAAFNCIPIPPLDGSAIVAYFYPPYRSLFGGRFGVLILLALIFIPIGGGTLLSLLVAPLSAWFNMVVHLFGILV